MNPHPLEQKLAAAWPPEDWRDLTVLLAVSGGADSIALVRMMHGLKTGGKGRLLVGHFNHGLRAAEADADQTFVVTLCQKLEFPCEVGRTDVAAIAETEGDGVEAAARSARYRFLQKTAERLGARYVVTAHTADDQVETILHRILRGTGLTGLSGMSRARPLGPALTLIRPMLEFRRTEVLKYLESLGQSYREDASNQLLHFTRNRIRHELLPRLACDYNAQVSDALLRLGSLAHQAQGVIDSLVRDLAERCVVRNSDADVLMDCVVLKQTDRYLVGELFKHVWREHGWPEQSMGFPQWDRLAEMSLSDSTNPQPKQTLPGGITAKKQGEQLRLARPGD